MPLSTYVTDLVTRVDTAIDAKDSNVEALVNSLFIAKGAAGQLGTGGGGGGAGQYYAPTRSTAAPQVDYTPAEIQAGVTIPAAAATEEARMIVNNGDADIWIRHEGPVNAGLTNGLYRLRPDGNSQYVGAAGAWMGAIYIRGNITTGRVSVSRES